MVPSLLVLSHEEQLDRLRAACPEAVPAAVVAGDVTQGLGSLVLAGLGELDPSPGPHLLIPAATWWVLGPVVLPIMAPFRAEFSRPVFRDTAPSE